MADLAEMLNGLLSDPNTTEKLRALLDNKPAPPEKKTEDKPALLPDGIDPAMMLKITRAMQHMNSKKSDNRTRLLSDLKPYVSSARSRRVDEAIEIMKILRVLDLFKDDFKGD